MSSLRLKLAGALAGIILIIAVVASAAELLTGEKIRAFLVGNTVQGSMIATGPYSEFYQPDGRVRSKDYIGNWYIDGDQMCFQYFSDPEYCWRVLRDGDAVQWIKDGRVEGTGTVVKGNPNNF